MMLPEGFDELSRDDAIAALLAEGYDQDAAEYIYGVSSGEIEDDEVD